MELSDLEKPMTWFCTPCGCDHAFGDICFYWDVDPDDPASVLYVAPDDSVTTTRGTTDG